MIFRDYVYFVAFVLNYVSFFKGYKRSLYSSIFFIFNSLIFVMLFNFLFDFLVGKFNVLFLNIKFLSLIFIVSIFLYFLGRKYVCITFSGTLVYLICVFLSVEISLKEIMFLIGVLHIFEGIFVIFSPNKKLYLPLVLNGFPIIFLMFYNRKSQRETFKYKRFVSGILIFIYGIIVLLITLFQSNVLFLILVCILHECIHLCENFIDHFTNLT